MGKNKYNAKKVEINGIKFDSKREARRAEELWLLEKAGKISNLKLQPKFKICDAVKYKDHRKLPARYYIADFEYIENGERVIEDVKSKATAKDKIYRLKRQLFLDRYGFLDFREIF